MQIEEEIFDFLNARKEELESAVADQREYRDQCRERLSYFEQRLSALENDLEEVTLYLATNYTDEA